MSHDQRPARMRIVNQAPVVSGGGQRRNDTAVAGDASGTAATAGTPAAAKSGGFPLFGTILFLIGCAAGGVGVAYVIGMAG